MVREVEGHRLVRRLEPVGVVREEHQRRQPGRADGVALGHGLGRIAHGVERVGDVADLLGQVRHLRDAAGVVGDRAIGVDRHDDAGHGEHGGRRDGDPVQLREGVGAPDRRRHQQHRDGGGLHGHAESGDDVGRVAGGGGRRDVLHRGVLLGGVVLGDPDHRAGQHETDQRRPVERAEAEALGREHIAHHEVRDGEEERSGERAGHDEAPVQGAHDLPVLRLLHEQRADHRGDDGCATEGERVDDGRDVVTGHAEDQRAEQHRGDDGDGVGLEEVGRHSCAVAHVVAHVVRDHRGVAGVVLGDAGLDLAHQVGTHVRALGEDATAEPREDRDEGAAEAETHQGVQGLLHLQAHAVDQHGVVARDPEQTESDHQQPGDGAAPEGELERGVQPRVGGLRRAHVGAHRDVHPDVARGGGEHGADGEADRRGRVQEVPEHGEEDHADDGDGAVLPVQVGHGAFLHGRRDLLHPGVAGRLGEDPAHRPDPECECHQGTEQSKDQHRLPSLRVVDQADRRPHAAAPTVPRPRSGPPRGLPLLTSSA